MLWLYYRLNFNIYKYLNWLKNFQLCCGCLKQILTRVRRATISCTILFVSFSEGTLVKLLESNKLVQIRNFILQDHLLVILNQQLIILMGLRIYGTIESVDTRESSLCSTYCTYYDKETKISW